jgi:hypothetical protein
VHDITELCNLFHSKKYEHILGKVTLNPNIFMLEIGFTYFCDCRYMPKNIYNKIPTIKYNNYLLISPIIIYIDAYKIFTDPLDSYTTLKTTFTNTYLLQTKYPLNIIKGNIIFNNSEYSTICNIILEQYIKNKNIILINTFAYNYYVTEKISITELDIISFNYEEDCNNIYKLLKNKYTNFIKKTEYLPFFHYNDCNTIITYKNKPIITIYNNNNKCIPYIKNTENYFISSFQYTVLMLLVSGIKSKVNDNNILQKNYNIMISNLFISRNNFFNKNKNNLLDDTLFREFQYECIGKCVSSNLQFRTLIYQNKQNKKRTYYYIPIVANFNPSSIKLPNISGNIMTNKT